MMNYPKRHILIKQLIYFDWVLLGLGLCGKAEATYCQVTISFQPDGSGNASVGYDPYGSQMVITSEQNTLSNFTVWMIAAVTMTTPYRGGDSCFASMIANGYAINFGNLQLIGEDERAFGNFVFIGRPDANHTYKGHAVNYQVPMAYAWENWPQYATGYLWKKIRVSVIDPSQPIKNFQFNPFDRFLKITSGQVSANLNGNWGFGFANNLIFKTPIKKNPICKRNVQRSRVSSTTFAPDKTLPKVDDYFGFMTLASRG